MRIYSILIFLSFALDVFSFELDMSFLVCINTENVQSEFINLPINDWHSVAVKTSKEKGCYKIGRWCDENTFYMPGFDSDDFGEFDRNFYMYIKSDSFEKDKRVEFNVEEDRMRFEYAPRSNILVTPIEYKNKAYKKSYKLQHSGVGLFHLRDLLPTFSTSMYLDDFHERFIVDFNLSIMAEGKERKLRLKNNSCEEYEYKKMRTQSKLNIKGVKNIIKCNSSTYALDTGILKYPKYIHFDLKDINNLSAKNLKIKVKRYDYLYLDPDEPSLHSTTEYYVKPFFESKNVLRFDIQKQLPEINMLVESLEDNKSYFRHDYSFSLINNEVTLFSFELKTLGCNNELYKLVQKWHKDIQEKKKKELSRKAVKRPKIIIPKKQVETLDEDRLNIKFFRFCSSKPESVKYVKLDEAKGLNENEFRSVYKKNICLDVTSFDKTRDEFYISDFKQNKGEGLTLLINSPGMVSGEKEINITYFGEEITCEKCVKGKCIKQSRKNVELLNTSVDAIKYYNHNFIHFPLRFWKFLDNKVLENVKVLMEYRHSEAEESQTIGLIDKIEGKSLCQ